MTWMISPSEKRFITEGIQYNLRSDGRSRMEYSTFMLATDIISQANGSARIRLSTVDVLIGIKLGLDRPTLQQPQQGQLFCQVDCSASASQEYEGRGADEINNELTQLMHHFLIHENGVNLTQLCIVKKEYCWNMYIDVLVLDYGGNLVDAIFMGTRAALATTKLPGVVVQQGQGITEVEVSDKPEDTRSFNVDSIPICITMCKIGDRFIVDPDILEEHCIDAKIFIAVNSSGNFCGIRKFGCGTIDASMMMEMMHAAKKMGPFLILQMNTKQKRGGSLQMFLQ